jgi:hypothetical protein
VDFIQLEQQYRGKTLAALIEAHTRTMTREILIQAIRGTLIEFEDNLRPQMEEYAGQYLQGWLTQEQLHSDLGELFTNALHDFRQMSQQQGLGLDDKRIFDLFHASVLKLALLAHTDNAVKSLLHNKPA